VDTPPERPEGAAPEDAASPRGGAGEVFRVFLLLGLTSFGGPVAHLGYFRDAFVERRRWLTDADYADLVALCQFLPGPASSQVGMAIGLQRAGIAGLLAAWFAFTMPSAIALVAFAYGMQAISGDNSWIDGLKAAAVAVVAHAVVGMARNLTPDFKRALLAVVAMLATLAIAGAAAQVLVIVGAGAIGYLWLRPVAQESEDGNGIAVPGGGGAGGGGGGGLGVGGGGGAGAAAVVSHSGLALFDSFYRAGSLVFGGGHVVLPLLEAGTVQTGLVERDTFLAGYGAAQAVPGPLFTFAAFLGAVTTSGPTGVLGASIALVAIFLPSALLIVGALPFWERLRHAPQAQRALMGVNAGVVGLLAAAFVTPVVTAGVTSVWAGGLALAAYVALTFRVPAWAVVIAAGLLGLVVL
jgi:chromate transporter